MRDITNYNNKGQRHGQYERYTNDGEIMHRCVYKNDKYIGYAEWHYEYHYPKQTYFYIK